MNAFKNPEESAITYFIVVSYHKYIEETKIIRNAGIEFKEVILLTKMN